MLEDFKVLSEVTKEYGSPMYIFDEKGFVQNYQQLLSTLKKQYNNYQIAYSFKTNYTPYIISVVKNLGGYAEVVSGMEYYIAKKMGYLDEKIIFNGPNKGEDGKKAFLNGCILNIDNIEEAKMLCNVAKDHPNQHFEVGIRVNIDVGQKFISRFGIDVNEIDSVFDLIKETDNLSVVGLHCHISRCRGADAWKKRTEIMLKLADHYFEKSPKYIDLGSGMFGSMDPEFAMQFDNIPSYNDYALNVAKLFQEHYKEYECKPILFTEPGTTLINRFVNFIGRVDSIKCVRGKNIAILNCSEHNLGETCTLKELPLKVISMRKQQEYFSDIDITGYTCLEQDVMRKNYKGYLAVGDYIIFGNVGGYSNVLKPPFIWPNCKMIAILENGETKIIKREETYDDILHTYIF